MTPDYGCNPFVTLMWLKLESLENMTMVHKDILKSLSLTMQNAAVNIREEEYSYVKKGLD